MWTMVTMFCSWADKNSTLISSLSFPLFKLHYALLGHYPRSNPCKMERALALTSDLSCNQSFPPGFHWVARQLSTPVSYASPLPNTPLSHPLLVFPSLSLSSRGLWIRVTTPFKRHCSVTTLQTCSQCAWIVALLSQDALCQSEERLECIDR